MSTKTKTAMETAEVETNIKARPTRNVKPVSYNEITISKRGTAKESSSEPKDKKKKKVNGNSNDDAPTKKSGKKKPNGNVENTNDEDELMPESRKQPAESVDEKPKKPIGRKKKPEATAVSGVAAAVENPADDETISEPEVKKESKTTTQRKGKGAVEVTNGDDASKPVESEAMSSKTNGKGKKAEAKSDSPPVVSKPATTKSVKGKKGAKETKDVEVNSDGQDDVPAKPVAVVAPKQVASKTAKGKKAAKDDVEAESDDQNSQDEVSAKPVAVVTSKQVTSKTGKSKKAAKEPNDVVDDTDDVPAKATKGRPRKVVPPKGKTCFLLVFRFISFFKFYFSFTQSLNQAMIKVPLLRVQVDTI